MRLRRALLRLPAAPAQAGTHERHAPLSRPMSLSLVMAGSTRDPSPASGRARSALRSRMPGRARHDGS